jgi:hypothetical protein
VSKGPICFDESYWTVKVEGGPSYMVPTSWHGEPVRDGVRGEELMRELAVECEEAIEQIDATQADAS